MNYTTGNAKVDAVGMINFSGNTIPHTWYKTICYESGKPNLNAIIILSDIVYWYRPQEVREEKNGQISGYKKKFASDLLQRSYAQISDMFGLSKRQATAAIDFLQTLGVIRKEFRTVQTAGQVLNNVLFLDIVPERLKELTYPPKGDGDGPLSGQDVPPVTSECERVSQPYVTGITLERETNTEISTETTDRDFNNQIYPHPARAEPMDGIEAYQKLIRRNIDYEIFMERLSHSDRERFEELYQLICDVVCMPRRNIRIGGQEYPHKIVKSRFLKLRATHLIYVIECLDQTTTKITNIRAYLLTALYRSIETVHNQISQRVLHDMYGTYDEEAKIA